MSDALFDLPGPPAEPAPKESATVRRTRRQAAMLAAGVHPLSAVLTRKLRVHPEAAPHDDRKAEGRRCGNCRWRQNNAWGYPKCMVGGGIRASRSEASDVRAWWSACLQHEWKGDAE